LVKSIDTDDWESALDQNQIELPDVPDETVLSVQPYLSHVHVVAAGRRLGITESGMITVVPGDTQKDDHLAMNWWWVPHCRLLLCTLHDGWSGPWIASVAADGDHAFLSVIASAPLAGSKNLLLKNLLKDIRMSSTETVLDHRPPLNSWIELRFKWVDHKG
jgi:hypothetical protein